LSIFAEIFRNIFNNNGKRFDGNRFVSLNTFQGRKGLNIIRNQLEGVYGCFQS
jgi:hypothetical protein